MRKFKTFQQLKARQWWWLWVAYWRLWPTLLRIKLKQGSWLRKKINLKAQKGIGEVSTVVYAHEMYAAIRLAARLHFIEATCLPKSIVLADMLVQKGAGAKVVIGVQKTAGKTALGALASHAWVELDGAMVGEPEEVLESFIPLGA